MMSVKYALWIVVMLMSLAISGWYFASASPFTEKQTSKPSSSEVDAVIHHLFVRQYDAKGQLANSLQTPKVEHIPLHNTHQLQAPRIIMTESGQPAFTVSAEEAVSVGGGEEITFIQHVVIHQIQNRQGEDGTLTTERLTYFPKKKWATTEAPVAYKQANNWIQALGMNAYLAEKRIELLKQARGTYEPKRS